MGITIQNSNGNGGSNSVLLSVIGIDPGRQGGIARLRGTPEAPLQELDLWEMRQPCVAWEFTPAKLEVFSDFLRPIIMQKSPNCVLIESPILKPHDGRKALVTIGANFGLLLGAWRYQAHCVQTVAPQTWKAALGVAGEDRDLRLFRELFAFCDRTFDASLVDCGLLAVYAMLRLVLKKPATKPREKCQAWFHPYPFTHGRRYNSNGDTRNREADRCGAV